MELSDRYHNRFFLVLLFCLLFSAFGCGDAEKNQDDELNSDQDYGSAVFSIIWMDKDRARVDGFHNALSDIKTIDCEVRNLNDETIASEQGWQFSAGTGTVTNIPVGTDRRFLLFGRNETGAVIYSGEKTGITITAGTNDIGSIPVAQTDTEPPTIERFEPNDLSDVPPNTNLIVTFSEDMDAMTINTETFLLSDATKNIAGTVTYSELSAIFKPENDLEYNTTYTLRLTTGIKDSAGNPLGQEYIREFTTGNEPDNESPTIISRSPESGATGVSVNTTITVIFSEDMDSNSINTSSFAVSDGASNIAGDVSDSGEKATFTPKSALNPNQTYTVNVSAKVQDAAGNMLNEDVIWSFTTITDGGGEEPTVQKPSAITNGAIDIQTNEATLTGIVNPQGSDTIVYFEFGFDENYGDFTAEKNIGGGSLEVDVFQKIGGLAPGTTYHFRCVAENEFGLSFGDDNIFSTVGR